MTNSVDAVQTPLYAASDHGLYCLLRFISQYFGANTVYAIGIRLYVTIARIFVLIASGNIRACNKDLRDSNRVTRIVVL